MARAPAVDRAPAYDPAVTSVLVAALDLVEDAVFLLSSDGGVLHANAVARCRLDEEGEALRQRLARALHAPERDLDVRATQDAGEPVRYLVIARDRDRVTWMTATAALRWGLTSRQRDVLVCIVRGFSNLRTALELDIAERTVEVHLTTIFQRTRCSSRTELIASVLLGGETIAP